MTISLSAVALSEIVDLRIVFLGEGAEIARDDVGEAKESFEPDLFKPLPLAEPAEGDRTMGDDGPELPPCVTPAVGADEELMMLSSKLPDPISDLAE